MLAPVVGLKGNNQPGAALQDSGEQACPCGELDRDGAAIGGCPCAAPGRPDTLRVAAAMAYGPPAEPGPESAVRQLSGTRRRADSSIIRAREPVERDRSAIQDVRHINPRQCRIAAPQPAEPVNGGLGDPVHRPERGGGERQIVVFVCRVGVVAVRPVPHEPDNSPVWIKPGSLERPWLAVRPPYGVEQRRRVQW